MGLLTLIIIVIALGLIVYGINRWVPIAEPYKSIANILLLIVAIVLLLRYAGVIGSVNL